MSRLGADADRLKLGKHRILRDPVNGRAFASDVFDIVQVSIQHQRKFAGGKKTRKNRETGVELQFLSAEFFHIRQALLFAHAPELPGEPLRLGVIHTDLAFPLWIQQILIALWHFVAFQHARVVADNIGHHINRGPITVWVEERSLNIFYFR